MTYKQMKIIIPGNPIPKKRARVFSKAGKSFCFDPQFKEKVNISSLLKNEIKLNGLKIELDSFMSFNVAFFIGYPKSLPIQRKHHSFWKLGTSYPTNCDLDNLIKFILDCANSILYHDDRQIIHITASKQYSDNPRTEITLMQHNPLNLKEPILTFLGIIDPNTLKELISDAEKISKLDPEAFESLDDLYKINQLTTTSNLVIQFAQKYSEPLKRIKTKCKS